MCFNYKMGFEPEPSNNLGNDASQREIESFRGPQGLKATPFVECYRTGEHDLHNVYESTRLGCRKQLAHEWPGRFADMSARAAASFADDFSLPRGIRTACRPALRIRSL
jgi:hypothetical protein